MTLRERTCSMHKKTYKYLFLSCKLQFEYEFRQKCIPRCKEIQQITCFFGKKKRKLRERILISPMMYVFFKVIQFYQSMKTKNLIIFIQSMYTCIYF